MPVEPPYAVLRDFALSGQAVPLIGGDALAYRVGGFVVKPVDDAEEATYAAEVIDSAVARHPLHQPMPIRVPRPRRTADGAWLSNGWAAWEYLPGDHRRDWPNVIAAGAYLNSMLAELPRPAFLNSRTSDWVVGDLVAFGERDEVDIPAPMKRLVDELVRLRRPLAAPSSQLIHADLTGNVLFADPLPPAVIDFTPFHRPPGYASAGVVVDAVIWHGAALDPLAALIQPAVDRHQLLIRATIFRAITSARYWLPDPAAIEREAAAYGAFVARLATIIRE